MGENVGRDIHLHIEQKINDTWHYYGNPEVPRNRALFETLIKHKDGMFPFDMTTETKFHYQRRLGDWHSVGWLTSSLVLLIIAGLKLKSREYFGLFYGYSFEVFFNDPEKRFQVERDHGLTDFRFIFWFDN
jgi:hypothetical protein